MSPPLPTVAAGAACSQQGGGIPPRVLVVDDEADARGVMAMLLEMEGYEVQQAGDGVEALDALRAGPIPCVVLLDLMMPRLDGWGVVREMQAAPALAGIPVVLVSGVADIDDDPPGPAVIAALTKPVDVDLLLETIQTCCRR